MLHPNLPIVKKKKKPLWTNLPIFPTQSIPHLEKKMLLIDLILVTCFQVIDYKVFTIKAKQITEAS